MDKQSAINIQRGNLKFKCCKECGFVFNSAFNHNKIIYDAAYDNTQTCSSCFKDYVESLLRYLVQHRFVRNARIVEVGCGKGYFLRRLIELDSGNTGYGFDPTYVGPEIEFGGRLKFEKRLYGPDCAHITADVVICRHVIEHVPHPIALMRSIRKALGKSQTSRVFLETPCIEWILRNKVIWDFFYEHCSLFSVSSVTRLFEKTGFKVEHVRHMFHGQYLWVEGRVAPKDTDVSKPRCQVPQLAREFSQEEPALRESWKHKVYQLLNRGERIAIWGAGAKGVTFANLVDPKAEMISCIVDLNPQKQRKYLPGTGHPIVDYRELWRFGVTTAILMNPNYRQENEKLLRKTDLNVKFVDL